LAAVVSLPTFESYRNTTQRAKLKVHQSYAEGTGGKSTALLSLAKKHRKVVIFTTPSLVRWYADVFLHEGITVGAYSDYISTPSLRVLEAFNAVDRAVLVVSSELAADWSSEATCIALCDLPATSRRPELFKMVNRGQAVEVHLINCSFSTSTVKALTELVEG
jgi:hypothetical protein